MSDYDAKDFSCVISCCGCGTKLDSPDKVPWLLRDIFEDWNLDDPPAIDAGDLNAFRRVRDELKDKVDGLLLRLGDEARNS